ncbi:MAG: hypothetical protein KAU90_00810, partial [Sulfurovaceae bacterium]|nr:hypothetical protein [Sulfurovaceae bacterium]
GTFAFAGGNIGKSAFVVNDTNSAEIEALKQQMSSMQQKITELENRKPDTKATTKEIKEPKAKGTVLKSKVPVLKFNGTHYLGFVHTEPESGDSDDKFETRRNYFQAKAYFKENPKDYARVTMDTYTTGEGRTNFTLKYAYLYLDNVLPSTGVEFGQVHRPWIDYEEHNGWLYRSIGKTFVEEHNGAHFTNSADRGINFKTKTEYFSSELGVFNGEGYHEKDMDEAKDRGLSYEWRLTANILGTGKKHTHARKDTYANLSFLGQYNQKHIGAEDFKWVGLHAVYNQPSFLIAGMYTKSNELKGDKHTGDGYSINGEYRPADKWTILGRYDSFSADDDKDREEYIAGVAYDYNKNVKFIGNLFHVDGDTNIDDNAEDKFMLTAEVEW